MNKFFIGVDVGGMSIKAALVDKDGNIIKKETKETNAKDGPGPFLRDIKDLLLYLIDYAKTRESKVVAIGFGIPGVVNTKEGIIDNAANLYMQHVNLKDYLKDLKIPVFLSNDANVACLGESKFGVAKDFKNVLMLTLGTGVGGGVVIDGKLFEGTEGKGTELGHMVIVADGHQCACGNKGCFEQYASASALLRYTKEEMMNNKDSLMWKYAKGSIEHIDGRTSFECAKVGDVSANFVVNKYVKYLSIGILNYCNIFRPEAIVIGGGISNQGDYLLNKVKEYCQERNYGYKETPVPKMLIAKLKNDAGVIGAAALAMEKVENL